MKLKINLILFLLATSISHYSQAPVSIDFDLRGRDCSGGRGICSASKINTPGNGILVQKSAENTVVLSVLRSSLTQNEESSILGQSFSDFQSDLPEMFIQDGDIKFSQDVLKVMGIDPKYNLLKSGGYPMKIDETNVKITLTLLEGG